MSDDSPLTPEDRAMLDLVRDTDEPSASDRARVRIALIAQLGVGIGLGTAVTSTSTAASAAGTAAVATSFGGAKMIAVIALVGVVGVVGAVGIGVGVNRRASLRPTSQVAAASSLSTLREARPTPVGTIEPLAPPSPTSSVVDPPVAIAPSGATTPSAPSVPSVRASSTRALSLDDETHLVGGGAAALRDGRPAEALALFDEHARAYPHGTLAEERAAERILALCALGRSLDAKIDADRFLRDRPASPLAVRVRTSCAGDSSSP